MQAVQLSEKQVGECAECYRYRNNMVYQIDKGVICSDCLLKLKNCKVITEIIDNRVSQIGNDASKANAKRSIKTKIQQPRKVKEKKEKTPKIKEKKEKTLDKCIKEIYNFLKNSCTYHKAYDLRQIATKMNVYRSIKQLAEEGKVFILKHKRMLYVVDIEKENLLKEFINSHQSTTRQRMNRINRMQSIIDILLKDCTGFLTSREIANKLQISITHIYYVLNCLVQDGKIAKADKHCLAYYVHIDNFDKLYQLVDDGYTVRTITDNHIQIEKIILEKPKPLKSRSESLVLGYIQNSNKILNSTMFNDSHWGFCTRTGVRAIVSLSEQGLIACSNFVKGQKFYFCDISKSDLVSQINEINQGQTRVKVMKILKSSTNFLSINQIIERCDKYKSGGTYRYVKKILNELDNIEVITNQVGSLYRLKKLTN